MPTPRQIIPVQLRSRLSRTRGNIEAARRRAAGRAFGARIPTPKPPLPLTEMGELARYFDEHLEGPGIWKWRHYFPIYERHFAKFVNEEVHVVEIGVFSGGSLGMWSSYFGPNAHIYGVDIEPACRRYEQGQVRIMIGDQADSKFWQHFVQEVPAIDIIIDDGGHEAHQQVATLEALLPRLRPGGVYLCEDVSGEDNAFHDYVDGLTRNLHAWGEQSEDGTRPASAFQQAIKSIHQYPWVVVIEKHDTAIGRLVAPKHGTQWEPFFD